MIIFQSTWPQLDISSCPYQSYSVIALILLYLAVPFLQPHAVFVWHNTIQKHPWCKKARPSQKHQLRTSIFCMQLKDVISGRGQGLLGFNHFVYTAIYNHVQTNRNNACRQTIET